MNYLYAEPNYHRPVQNTTCKILAEGEHAGFKYIVVDNFFCPTAYVEIPDDSLFSGCIYHSPLLEDINSLAHCGLTFSDTLINLKTDRKPNIINPDHWFIGWDYGHLPDRKRIGNLYIGTRTYSTAQIMVDCQNICKALSKIYAVPNNSDLLYYKEQECLSIVNHLKIKHPCFLKQIYDVGANNIIMFNPDGEGIRIGHLSDKTYPVSPDLLGIECEIISIDMDSDNLTVLDAQCSMEDYQRLEEVFALENKV